MDKLGFWTVTKYLGGLKQEIQDEIVDAIWDMRTTIAKANKLEERKQRSFSRTQQ